MDASDLRAFAEAVEPCLRWKYDPVTAARLPDAERLDALEEWVARVQEEWGACGRMVVVDEVPLGYVLYAPPAHLPGLGDVATGPPSADAVVLAEMYVLPEARRAGVGKLLVHAAAKDLVLREVAALETFGTYADVAAAAETAETAPPGRTDHLLPVGFLESVGFATHRTHSTTPRMRMDLRAARSWMDEVELALERLVGAVRPVIRPRFKPRFKPVAKPQTRSLRSGPRAP
ncbi:GNAT family N-acetyltransferase [Nocardioides gilvus]|uniref:GNAT family N-acetyltransferase n=1 Tax=Nocardioides gilvus TaxID=1735589 RepID=UPI0013A52BEA|nr:GNAT family N-acetyltransferase [Nocardioides gilvus]